MLGCKSRACCDVESVGMSRKEGGEEAYISVVTTLLAVMDGLKPSRQVVVPCLASAVQVTCFPFFLAQHIARNAWRELNVVLVSSRIHDEQPHSLHESLHTSSQLPLSPSRLWPCIMMYHHMFCFGHQSSNKQVEPDGHFGALYVRMLASHK